MDEKAVVYELFHSIVREVRDEVSAGCVIACDCNLVYMVTSLLKFVFLFGHAKFEMRHFVSFQRFTTSCFISNYTKKFWK